MPVITEDLANLAGIADNSTPVTFFVSAARSKSTGTGLVTPTTPVPCYPVAGVITSPNLDPGPAKVRIGTETFDIYIPTVPSRLRSLLDAAVTYPPQAVGEAQAARDAAGGYAISAGNSAMDAAASKVAAAQSATQAGSAAATAVQQAIDALKAGAPAAYDTLMEIATKLDADDSALAAILTSISDRFTKSQTDARYLRTVNGAAPDTTGNALIGPWLGNHSVVLGNSVDLSQEAPSASSRNSSPFNYACIMSGRRIGYAFNAGVAGDTTAQMLARFDTQVAPHFPRIVFLGGGENDADPARSVDFTTFVSNMNTLAAKVRAIGAAIVLRTTCPINDTGTRRTNVAKINAWIRANANRLGALAVLDYFSVLVDPTSGGYLAAYNSGDGIHPNDAGNAALGQYTSDLLVPLLPEPGKFLAQTNTGDGNLLTNGLFLGPLQGGNLDQVSGWLLYADGGGALGATVSLVAGSNGNWYTLDVTNNAQTINLLHLGAASNQLPAAGLIGHELRYAVRVRSNLTAGRLGSCEVVIDATTPQLMRVANDMAGKIADGILALPFKPGAGATTIGLAFKIPAGTVGRLQFAQAGVFDLTALGALT